MTYTSTSLARSIADALTERQRTLIEMHTPHLYPRLRGWPAAEIIAELHEARTWAGEITEFLAGNPDLARDPRAEYAATAMRALNRIYTRTLLDEILARAVMVPL